MGVSTIFKAIAFTILIIFLLLIGFLAISYILHLTANNWKNLCSGKSDPICSAVNKAVNVSETFWSSSSTQSSTQSSSVPTGERVRIVIENKRYICVPE